MLLSESEKAKQVHSLILDIVIASIHEHTGGETKYNNRCDANTYQAPLSKSTTENRLFRLSINALMVTKQ
jgi:hypothetical protein